MVKTRHSVEVDDSPAQFVSLRRLSSRRKASYETAQFSSEESDGEFVQEMRTRKGRNAKRSSPRRRVRCVEESPEDGTPELEMVSKSERRRDAVNGSSYGVIRRSSRKRKPLYDTLNQSLIIDNAALGLVDVKGGMSDGALTRSHRGKQNEIDDEEEFQEQEGIVDMYSRVKRGRRACKKDMYGIPLPDEGEETDETEAEGNGDNDQEDEDNNKDDDGDNDDDDDDDDVLPPRRSYFLREHKPRTQIYEAPPIGPQLRRSGKPPGLFSVSPPIQKKNRDHQMYRSPARRNSIRRKAAFHGSSSTSSDSSSSDDENRFQRRKSKSMAKARNRCLPMNLEADDMKGLRKDRARIGSSLADVDPMAVDRSITFESVGGLGKHVRALKEMVVFPLLYPEVFEKFKISPPRGVLFYGPPGTGKTLVARALANECSNDDRRVAFFMRKGADCLSKWVGESERQLRLLFDQAYQMRPSIIFFDEIDGLAPVRSSRQDQIHSSIVSTLLALMDGLDSRGEIVVIGATNRIDSIDPALRRPGRFDREFLFPLPSVQARQQILSIHTKAWTPKLLDPFLTQLAERCVGYCGADLKALCTEAALLALRRRYPQIYTSSEKLQLDVSSINVSAKDFSNAMQVIVPTAQRSVTSPARALSKTVAPLLRVLLEEVMNMLQSVFPSQCTQSAGVDTPDNDKTSQDIRQVDLCSDDDEDAPSIFTQTSGKQHKNNNNTQPQHNFFHFTSSSTAITHRPRLLLSGHSGQGQTSHLAPAVLHQLERLPVHILDLPALFACSAKTPEESCSQVFREARRTSPSIIFMPHVDQWWPVLTDTLQATFLTLVHDMEPCSPILLFATADVTYLSLHTTLQELFDNRFGEVVTMRNPNQAERKEFFEDLLLTQATKPPTRKRQAALRALEVLPKAAPPKEKELTSAEKKKMEEQEEATYRELRLFLRDALNKIARDRKFNIFAKPVDIEEVPDYYEIVKNPMDLSTMMSKIDLYLYHSVKEFISDITLICTNALEYNPDKDPGDRAIRHRACALRDTAHSIIKNELDPDFEKLCEEMAESRRRRGAELPKSIPDFYFTKPVHKASHDMTLHPARFSKRARGLEAEDYSSFLTNKRPRSVNKIVENMNDSVTPTTKTIESPMCDTPKSRNSSDSAKKPVSSSKKPYKRPKCVWNYTSRRRRRIQQAIRLHRAQKRKASDSVCEEPPEVKAESSAEEEEEEIIFNKSIPIEALNETLDTDTNSQETITDLINHNDDQAKDIEGERTPVSQSDTALPETISKQSPPAKRDLDFSDIKLLNTETTSGAVIDSGLGSSMESNCESMDSVDQLKQQTGLTEEVARAITPVEDQGETTKEVELDKTVEEMEISKTTPPSAIRMTRSRAGNKDTQLAVEILEAPEEPLVVDKERLNSLLTVVVEKTDNYDVERLGKLYSMLTRCIYQHKKEYNKTQLIEDLELSVRRYTSDGDTGVMVVPSTSNPCNY